MSVISAGTTLTTALVQTGDTNGNLVFKTGSGGTTALTLGSDQSATFAGAVSFGTSAFGAGSASAPSITFTGDTNTGIYSPAADTIAFTEGGVESMRIDSSGNVGIGTSSPTEKLTVAGAGLFSGALVDDRTSAAALDFSSGSARLISYGASGVGGVIQFRTGSGGASTTERMRIDSSGNVGIGTNTPDIFARGYTRSIGFSSNGTTALEINGTTYGTIDLGAGGVRASAITGSATELQVSTVTNIPLLLVTNGIERMRIDSSGNVGIGTSSPVAKLHVSGGIIRLQSPDNYDGNLRLANTGREWLLGMLGTPGSTQFNIFDVTSGTSRLTIDTSGNLGFNSGYGSVATAYGCRAWVNFNGTGTVAIRASGNVSSITDQGTGQYAINFTNAMPDANYSAYAFNMAGGSGWRTFVTIGNGVTASSFSCIFITSASAYDDPSTVGVAVFR